MATPIAQLDQLISSTYDKLKSRVADNVTKKEALLAALDSKSSIREDGGLTIRLPIMHALNNTVKSYSGYDILDTTPQGGLAYAEYPFRQFAGSVTIAGEEEKKNSGTAAVVNLVRFKFDQLEASISDYLTKELWATSRSAKDILSVPMIVDDAYYGGDVGGIDPADATWWKAVTVGTVASFDGTAANAGVDLTTLAGVKKLNNVLNSLQVNNSRPDLEFTTQANFEAYEALSLNQLRHTDTKLAQLGFETINHKTAEVVFEPQVPKGTGHASNAAQDGGMWFFLNSKNLLFIKHSNRWMERTEFMRPVDQDAKTMQVLSMGNLATDIRRAHGVIRTAKVS